MTADNCQMLKVENYFEVWKITICVCILDFYLNVNILLFLLICMYVVYFISGLFESGISLLFSLFFHITNLCNFMQHTVIKYYSKVFAVMYLLHVFGLFVYDASKYKIYLYIEVTFDLTNF